MNTTKSLLISLMAFALVLTPFAIYGQSAQTGTVITQPTQAGTTNTRSEQMSKKAPPVSQTLIPEGDFALKLVTALKLGTATTEAQAEDMLTSAGIAPKNGWIADYPMTPIIIGEVQSAVVAAAGSKKLPMEKDEALQAFQGVTAEFGLAVLPGSGQYAETQPPTSSEYVPPAEINNYYYEEGPPVVSYYPPPWDYGYLYAWVPYPFWCSGFFFSGFFVLNDFHRVVVGHHHHPHVISNHFIDPRTHTALRVDPTTRTMGRTVNASLSRTHGLNSTEGRRGAASIFERSRTRQMANMNSNNVQRPSGGSSRSFGSPSRSFSAPRSFSSPSTDGRGSLGGFQGHGSSFGHSGFSGGFHGGGFGGGGGFHGGGGGHR
jgi:hypothetical protein